MNHQRALTITSLLSIILFSLHWADEIARGLEPGTTAAAGGFVILTVWLSATLVFADRRWGVVLILLGALLASVVPILHMQGRGWALGRYGVGSTLLFWVWTNIALGASGMVSVVLSLRVLWGMRAAHRAPPS